MKNTIPPYLYPLVNTPLKAALSSLLLTEVTCTIITLLVAPEFILLSLLLGGLCGFFVPLLMTPILFRYQKRIEEQNFTLETLTKQLNDINSELAASNKELDAYAHTISHDLKTPLANIDALAQFLLLYSTELSPDDLKEKLQTIEQECLSMDETIENILLLADAHRAEEVEANIIEMDHVIHDVLKKIEPLKCQYQANIESPEKKWPTAVGFAPWIQIIWLNFISSIIKNTDHKPNLKLGFDNLTDEVRYWVKDLTPPKNGSSSTPQKMPHSNQNITLISRIISRMKGKVGSTQDEKGIQTFYFILPKVPSPSSPESKTGRNLVLPNLLYLLPLAN